MLVLGLNPAENAAAALVSDGALVFAAEEERFVGCKHVPGVPYHAIEAGLDHLGIRLRDVDRIAIGWNPALGITRRVLGAMTAWNPRATSGVVRRGLGYARLLADVVFIRNRLADRWPGEPLRAPVRLWPHHLAHAASAYHWSGERDVAVLTVDGVGEEETIVLWRARDGRFEALGRRVFPDSLGHFYSTMTGFLGFDMGDGEGKLMGLAPYGTPRYRDALQAWTSNGHGNFKLDARRLNYAAARTGRFHPDVVRILGAPVVGPTERDERHRDLAASTQAVLEHHLATLARTLHQRGPAPALAVSGGVALNCCANGRLHDLGLFPRIHVSPAPTDAGTAIGAALLEASRAGDRAHISESVFLGTRDDSRLPDDLPGLFVRDLEDPAPAVAGLLAGGHIVGVFCDRMELGPRALGNRSILCPAAPGDMKSRVNDGVKFREPFRPFAPALLAEEAADYFELPGASPYMTFAFRARDRARRMMPATVHVDDTGRVQTVAAEPRTMLRRILEAYRERTGCAGLLNTSFNVKGKPITATKAEALRLLRDTQLDALLADGQLVVKHHALAAAATPRSGPIDPDLAHR